MSKPVEIIEYMKQRASKFFSLSQHACVMETAELRECDSGNFKFFPPPTTTLSLESTSARQQALSKIILYHSSCITHISSNAVKFPLVKAILISYYYKYKLLISRTLHCLSSSDVRMT